MGANYDLIMVVHDPADRGIGYQQPPSLLDLQCGFVREFKRIASLGHAAIFHTQSNHQPGAKSNGAGKQGQKEIIT